MYRPGGVPTWRHSEFELEELVRVKRGAGSSVAVVIPARNEEATIGAIAVCVAETCVDRGLVDELLVVDSDSQDATAARAREAGAKVVAHEEVLPEAGPGAGKGEALWKGLAATSSELVIFVDGDIEDFDERFVLGLLGPLLKGDVEFVKGAYDRPLKFGGHLHSGGGRVTELLARPLLAAWWPELARLAQPLAGEYAGHRRLFEDLPIVQGYGVELALLVDILATHGPGAIGQVDLGRRIHRNQDVASLGRMAFEILHVAVARARSQGRIGPSDMGKILPQIRRGVGGDYEAETWKVEPSERPPLSSVRPRGA